MSVLFALLRDNNRPLRKSAAPAGPARPLFSRYYPEPSLVGASFVEVPNAGNRLPRGGERARQRVQNGVVNQQEPTLPVFSRYAWKDPPVRRQVRVEFSRVKQPTPAGPIRSTGLLAGIIYGPAPVRAKVKPEWEINRTGENPVPPEPDALFRTLTASILEANDTASATAKVYIRATLTETEDDDTLSSNATTASTGVTAYLDKLEESDFVYAISSVAGYSNIIELAGEYEAQIDSGLQVDTDVISDSVKRYMPSQQVVRRPSGPVQKYIRRN